MADRFFCPDTPVDGGLVLEGDEARHLTRVRRVGLGESVELFDGRGSSHRAEVAGLGRDRVELIVKETTFSAPGPLGSLTLASAVPKGDRFDWLVEKATELGVTRLIPLVTERSSVDPRTAKIERLRRVVIEASKQCRRDYLMELAPPTSWGAVVKGARDPIRLIAHPGAPGIASIALNPAGGSVILAIGPEGGFTEAEVAEAGDRGWRVVGLGVNVMRVETAGLAGCSTLLALALAQVQVQAGSEHDRDSESLDEEKGA